MKNIFFKVKQQKQTLFLWNEKVKDTKHWLDSLMIVYPQVILICLSVVCLKFINIMATPIYSYH